MPMVVEAGTAVSQEAQTVDATLHRALTVLPATSASCETVATIWEAPEAIVLG
jgi:hypothetical protein